MEIDSEVYRFLILRLCDDQIIAVTDTLESARSIVEMTKGEDFLDVAIYEARYAFVPLYDESSDKERTIMEVPYDQH